MRRLAERCLRLLALMIGIVAGVAYAQVPSAIPAQARIRVETTNGNLETGRVVATRSDSLWLEVDGVDSVAAYRIADLRTYAISLGTPRGHGARRGALISGALGLVAVGISLHGDLTERDAVTIPATLFVAPAALIATLVGTGLGALFVEERWTAPEYLRLGLAPGAGGRVAVTYCITF